MCGLWDGVWFGAARLPVVTNIKPSGVTTGVGWRGRVEGGDETETVLQREQRITLHHMREYVTRYGEDAWRSVAGAGYTMPHRMAGRPREL